MSHHLDSPLSRKDPRLNLTDDYVFEGRFGTVLVMDVNTSLAGGTPGFHPEGRYEFRIALDDDTVESIVYRFAFGEADETGAQRWTLSRLSGREAADDREEGTPVLAGVTGLEATADSGLQAWVGRALDPFYLDLAQLGPISLAVEQGSAVDYGVWTPSQAANTFARSTVESIVLELPEDDILYLGRRIGVWSVTLLATDAGGWRQINRAGLPMMWPIFRPADSHLADHANSGAPEKDHEDYFDTIATQVKQLVSHRGGRHDPGAYGRSVASRILPDLLPYAIGSAACFGFAGFNGRALDDNAPEVMFSLVTDAATSTGLSPADSATHSDFPYVVPA